MEKCSNCQQSFSVRNIPNNVIKCSYCEKYYHGECQNIRDAGVIQYIRSGVQNVFNCKQCESKRDTLLSFVKKFEEQQKVFVELTALVRQQGEDIKNLRQEIKNASKNNACANTPTAKRTFASVINSESNIFSPAMKRIKATNSKVNTTPRKKPKQNVIVIQDKKGENTKNRAFEIEVALKENFDPIVDPIDSMRVTNKQKVIVRCRDESALLQMKKRIGEVMGKEYIVDKPKEIKKVLLFCDVPGVWPGNQVLWHMCKYPELKRLADKINVKHISSKRVAYVECDDDDTYNELLSKKILRLSWEVIRIRPCVNIRRCYNCQEYDHTAAECKSKKICAKCSGEHDVRLCNSSIVKCSNCVKKGNDAKDHCTWSSKCPFVKSRLNL